MQWRFESVSRQQHEVCQHLTMPKLKWPAETLKTYSCAKLIVTLAYPYFPLGLLSFWLWICLRLWKHWRLYSRQQPLLLKHIPIPLSVLDLAICLTCVWLFTFYPPLRCLFLEASKVFSFCLKFTFTWVQTRSVKTFNLQIWDSLLRKRPSISIWRLVIYMRHQN